MHKLFPVIFFVSGTLSVFGQNRIANPGFERGMEEWTTPSWAKKQAPHIEGVIDDRNGQGPAGTRSLRIDYRKGFRFLLTPVKPISLPEGETEYQLSFYTRSEGYERGAKGQLWVQVLFDGVKKGIGITTPWNVTQPEWTEFKTKFKLPPEAKKAFLQIQLIGHENQSGTTWVDNLYFGPVQEKDIADTQPKLAVEKAIPSAAHGGVYDPEETIRYDFLLKNVSVGKNAEIVWQVFDFDGNPLKSGKQEIQLARNVHCTLPSLEPYRGWFALKAEIRLDGRGISQSLCSGVIVERQTDLRDPFFASINGNAEKRSRLGIGAVPIETRQRREAKPGQYNFSDLEKAADTHLRNGFTPYMRLWFSARPVEYEPPFLVKQIQEKLKRNENPYDDAYFEGQRLYWRAMIRALGPKVADWCVPDEIHFTHHSVPFEVERYIRLVTIFGEELKKQFPNHVYTAGGVMMDQYPIGKTIWEAVHNHVDGLCSDVYLNTSFVGPGYPLSGPEQGKTRQRFLDVEKYIGPGKVIVNEETGYNFTRTMPLDHPILKEVSIINLRNLVIAKSIQSMRRWNWFCVEDNPAAWIGQQDFGMWQHGNPRPHAATFSVAARLLAFATDALEVKPSEDVYAYIFKQKGRSLAVLWAMTKELADVQLNMPSDWTATQFNGTRFQGKKGPVVLKLNDRPVFIEFSASQKKVAAAVSQGKYAMPEIYLSVNWTGKEEVSLFIRNKTNRELNATASLSESPAKKVKIPPLSRIGLPFSHKPENNPVRGYVDTDTVRYEISRSETLHRVPRLVRPPTLDTSLEGFENVSPIRLDNASFLKPIDAEPQGLWTGPEDLSLQFYLAYDNDYLYVAADVKDDVSVSRSEKFDIWNQDCIQFAFDMANNSFDPQTDPVGFLSDDREFCMAMTPGGPQLYCYFGNEKIQNKVIPGNVMIRENGNHKYYLARIPWQMLGGAGIPGRVFGFNLVAFDVDTPKGQISYHMELAPGIAGEKNPAFFKRFLLE